MPILDIADIEVATKLIPITFAECTPKILVVSDGLIPALTEFVATLRASTIHSMTPVVVAAQYNPAGVLNYNSATQSITNYKFTDPTHGLLKSRYDVVFILSSSSGAGGLLASEAGALAAIVTFMQAGGGLFATGDHDTLGAGMCNDIPRVNKMRKWVAGVPSGSDSTRLSTTAPGRGDVLGSNDTYEFNDQSDQFPQRLYANFRSVAGGFNTATPETGKAHPVLQIPNTTRVVEVFPDHAHEGECILPTSLAGNIPGTTPPAPEWPAGKAPEMVALTMSHGNGFPGKQAVVPRSFIAIAAYDGHSANVGRVVTDATWHHFVDVNIKPGIAQIAGRDLSDIKQYYINLAIWLMPKNVRLCRRYPWLLAEMVKFPLFEELPRLKIKEASGAQMRDIGAQVRAALLLRNTEAQVKALLDDALEEAVGAEAISKMSAEGSRMAHISLHDVGLAALGALTLATAQRFNELHAKEPLTEKAQWGGERAFMDVGQEAARAGAKLYLREAKAQLSKATDLLDTLAK